MSKKHPKNDACCSLSIEPIEPQQSDQIENNAPPPEPKKKPRIRFTASGPGCDCDTIEQIPEEQNAPDACCPDPGTGSPSGPTNSTKSCCIAVEEIPADDTENSAVPQGELAAPSSAEQSVWIALIVCGLALLSGFVSSAISFQPYLLAAGAVALVYAFFQSYKPAPADAPARSGSRATLWAITLITSGIVAFQTFNTAAPTPIPDASAPPTHAVSNP